MFAQIKFLLSFLQHMTKLQGLPGAERIHHKGPGVILERILTKEIYEAV